MARISPCIRLTKELGMVSTHPTAEKRSTGIPIKVQSEEKRHEVQGIPHPSFRALAVMGHYARLSQGWSFSKGQ